jgi:tRNA nucleotidyltransferase/poly(A) polymerase
MSDYIFLLESRLNPDQVQALAQVQQAASHAQLRVYLAGGAIRDLLSGLKIRDLDFCVEGPALKLVKQLDSRLFEIESTDPARQSAEIVFGGKATIEISMCRRETYSKPGAKPEIERSTIQDDLRRRDFSVNALALSLNPASRGLLLDPTNGLADIERKELRSLNTSSFYEEPVRMLRLVRLAARLGYTLEERTKSQLASALEAGMADRIPARARFTELTKLAAEMDSAGVVKALVQHELLDVFGPHLARKVDPPLLARLDKVRPAVEDAGVPVNSLGPFLYCLTRKLSGAERNGLKARTGMKASEASGWTGIEAQAKTLQKLLMGKISQPSKLYKILSGQDPAVAMFLLAFAPVPGVREKIKNYFTVIYPLARAVTDAEVEQKVALKRTSPKFAAAREAYVTALVDKKPEKVEVPPPKVEVVTKGPSPVVSPASKRNTR